MGHLTILFEAGYLFTNNKPLTPLQESIIIIMHQIIKKHKIETLGKMGV